MLARVEMLAMRSLWTSCSLVACFLLAAPALHAQPRTSGRTCRRSLEVGKQGKWADAIGELRHVVPVSAVNVHAGVCLPARDRVRLLG